MSEPLIRGKRGPTRQELRRRRQREELWPNTENLHYDRLTEVGFATVPRTLSLICSLIRSLATRGDPSKAYIDLWLRAFDEGFVEIDDEAELAMSCGYEQGTRNVRSWQERMKELEELGFIMVRPKPTRRYGYVLLVHPHYVVEKLRAQGRVPSGWHHLFLERLSEIGAKRVDIAKLDNELQSLRSLLSSLGNAAGQDTASAESMTADGRATGAGEA